MTYDGSTGETKPYYAIFIGDFPFIIDIEGERITMLSGLPMHRPTPFFFSFGTDLQFGFYDPYSKAALLQSASIGTHLDLFGTLTYDKFLTIGSRFYNLSHGFRFYEDSMRLENELTYSTDRYSIHGQTIYGIEDREFLDWEIGIDYRFKDHWSIRATFGDDYRCKVALGLSHYDPPADYAQDLPWDYVGAHRGP